MELQESTSFDLIGRLALEMSVSPAVQKRSKPAPLPMLSTVRLPGKPSSLNRSTIRSDSGNTVELPAVTILPGTSNGLIPGSMGSSDSSVMKAQPPPSSPEGAALTRAPVRRSTRTSRQLARRTNVDE